MSHGVFDNSREVSFYTFLPWYLVKIGLLLGFGAMCLIIAIAGDPRGWLGVAGVIGAAAALMSRYAVQSVTIRGIDLVFRRGVLTAHEVNLPLWNVRLEISQGPLGRLCGYGTVRQRINGEIVEIRTVAQIDLLRHIVAQARQELFRLAMEQRRLPYTLEDDDDVDRVTLNVRASMRRVARRN